MARCLFYIRNSIGCHIYNAKFSKPERSMACGKVILVKYFMKFSWYILTWSGADWQWETNRRTERKRQSVVINKMHDV